MPFPNVLEALRRQVRRLVPSRRKGASGIDYAVIVALVAVAVLGAVALTGDRIRTLFDESNTTVGDGVAGLPLPDGGGGTGGGNPPPGDGQGAWSGDGAFALSPLNTPQARTMVLTNVGTGALSLGGAPAVAGPGAAAFQVLSTDCGASLPAGDSCAVQIQAGATANGSATATLAVPGVPGGLALARTASGFDPSLAWSGGAAVSISGAPGPAPLPRAGQTVLTLTNQGFADATGVAPALSGPDAALFQIATDCPATLAPSASCTVTLSASASDNGAFSATLAAGGPASVSAPVSATAAGFAPALAWTGPASFAIAAPPATPASVENVLTLTNAGTLAAAGIAPAVSGPGFALVSTTCGPTLAPGDACAATVSFTAAANVASAAGLLASGTGADRTLSGSAIGIGPQLAWSATGVSIDGAPPAPVPSTATTVAVLANTGNQAAAGLGAVSVSGAGWSVIGTTCGATLAAGASCEATLALQASANGLYPATLAIAGGPSQPLAGQATGFGPALSWSAAAPFAIDGTPGPAPLPRTAEQTLTLTNAGNLGATGLSIAVSGAGFTLATTTCTTTLGAGQSCSATVVASADDNGGLAGALTSGGAPAASVALTGAASGFATAWAFDAAPAGTFSVAAPTTSQALTFALRNVGTRSGTPPARALSGPDAAAFSIVPAGGTCSNAAIAPGAACTVEVSYAPGADAAGQTALLAAGGAEKALTGSATGFAATLAWSGGGAISHNANSASPTVSFTLTNTGAFPSPPIAGTLAIASTPAGAFEISGGSCPNNNGGLAPNATCTVLVRLPANGPAGSLSGTLSTSAANAPTQALSGFRDAPFLSFEIVSGGTLDALLSAGANPVTATVANGGIVQVLMRNTGTGNITFVSGLNAGTNSTRSTSGIPTNFTLVSSSAVPGANLACQPGSNFTLNAGQACGLHLRYDAIDNGTGSLTLNLLQANQATLTAPVSVINMGPRLALGTAGPFTVPNSNGNFGATWPVGSGSGTINVTNTGNTTLGPLSFAFAGAHPGDFETNTGTCLTAPSLAPGANCTLTLRMTAIPASLETLGPRTATLVVSSGGAQTPALTLNGTRTGAWLVFETPGPVTLAYDPNGAATATTQVVIRNISPVNNTSASTLTNALEVVTPANGFATSTATGIEGFNCGTVIASANHACAFTITHTASTAGAPGTYNANLRINTGLANGRTVTLGVSATTVRTTTATTPSAFLLDAPGTTLASQQVIRDVEIRNTGNLAIAAGFARSIVSASGPAGAFALGTAPSNACATTLAVGATCVQRVVFTGTGDGTASATLRIVGTATTTVDVPLSATVSNWGPRFVAWSGGGALTPASGTTASQTFSLQNVGPVAGIPSPAPAVATATPGVALGIGTNTCAASVAPGAACQVQVIATYSAPATLSGTLSAGGATQALAGVYSGLTATSASGGLGTRLVEIGSGDNAGLATGYHIIRLVTVTNQTGTPVAISGRTAAGGTVSGATCGGSAVPPLGLVTVPAGGSCVFNVESPTFSVQSTPLNCVSTFNWSGSLTQTGANLPTPNPVSWTDNTTTVPVACPDTGGGGN